MKLSIIWAYLKPCPKYLPEKSKTKEGIESSQK